MSRLVEYNLHDSSSILAHHTLHDKVLHAHRKVCTSAKLSRLQQPALVTLLLSYSMTPTVTNTMCVAMCAVQGILLEQAVLHHPDRYQVYNLSRDSALSKGS